MSICPIYFFCDEIMINLNEFSTILDVFRYAVSEANRQDLYFGHGTDNAFDDMRSLILRTLSLPYDTPDNFLQGKLLNQEKLLLSDVLNKRITDRIPVPYLIHEAIFCDIPFYVDERVLIPRSPIAELIEQQFAPWINPDEVYHILDLCTGSGCIAIAAAMAFDDALVDAVDISEDALAVAEKNVSELGVEEEVSLIKSDLWNNLPKTTYDIIVSNPPYVSSQEMAELPEEYLHEPNLALETTDDGLLIVERILEQAASHLTPHGILIVEVGNAMWTLMERYPNVPFTWLEFERGGDGVFLLTQEDLLTYFPVKG